MARIKNQRKHFVKARNTSTQSIRNKEIQNAKCNNTKTLPTDTHTSFPQHGEAKHPHPTGNLAFKRLPNILTDQFRTQIFLSLLRWEYETRPTKEQHDMIAYLGRNARCEDWATDTYASPFTRSQASDIMTIGARILNQPPSVAAQHIARYFNLKAEYCFHSFPETQEESINEISQYVKVHDDLPAELIVNNSLFRLTTADYDYDFRGHKAQAISNMKTLHNASIL